MGSENGVDAWLEIRSGPQSGRRYLLNQPVTRVGRAPDNDFVLTGEGTGVVSSSHLELRSEGGEYRICDTDSTNGTLVAGQSITDVVAKPGDIITLGVGGPEIIFQTGEFEPSGLDRTIVLSPDSPGVSHSRSARSADQTAELASSAHEKLVSDAVSKARAARSSGDQGQTAMFVRQALGKAVVRSRNRWGGVVASLVTLFLAAGAYSYWTIENLKREKSDIDLHIQQIEGRLAGGGLSGTEVEALIERLNGYQARAQSLQGHVLYRLGVPHEEQAFLLQEIRILLAEFGAEDYSIPPEFVEQVNRFVERYQATDRARIEAALGSGRALLEEMREILAQRQLPPDLAYIALVESEFNRQNRSRAGAVGFWQFTPETGRAYGLRVNEEADDRLDLKKSTEAASRYLRDLILEFGAGSSVMLALAAYNSGPTRVRRAVRKVDDPIKQRNFWYLYRVDALPVETREYVPKVVAAILIGRNPERFGF